MGGGDAREKEKRWGVSTSAPGPSATHARTVLPVSERRRARLRRAGRNADRA